MRLVGCSAAARPSIESLLLFVAVPRKKSRAILVRDSCTDCGLKWLLRVGSPRYGLPLTVMTVYQQADLTTMINALSAREQRRVAGSA